MKITYEKIRANAKIPTKAHERDACWDVYSTESYIIDPGESYAVDTGLRFDIPEGYAIQVYSRSGLAVKNSIFVANAPGVIDSGYVGELSVILYNGGRKSFLVAEGAKVAQIRLVKLEDYVFEEGVVDMNTERGQAGFGSSGF